MACLIHISIEKMAFNYMKTKVYAQFVFQLSQFIAANNIRTKLGQRAI